VVAVLDLSSIGKAIISIGIGLVLLGFIFLASGKIPFLGRLPGDIRIEKENFSFYFPLATCLLLSLLGSFIFWLFSKFK
jgi:hypothetical protein